jgi:hypothetical protein
MFEIPGFASDPFGDETFSNVAIYTGNPGVGGFQVGCILRRHGVAGLTTKFWRVGIFPAIGSSPQEQDGQDTKGNIGGKSQPERGAFWWEEKTFDAVDELFHGSTFKRNLTGL